MDLFAGETDIFDGGRLNVSVWNITRLPCAGDLAPLLRRVVLIRETMLGGLVEHERDGGKGERCNGHFAERRGVPLS